MIDILKAIGPIFVLLLISEVLWRTKILRGESARKTLHIIIGSYVAIWPKFLSFEQIQVISLALLVVVLASHRLHIFHAINDVRRKTWGDSLYAVGIGLTATLTASPWIFAVAVLHMSVADGFAGLIGTRYGKHNQYKVFGNTKSFLGTTTFIVLSFLILALFSKSCPTQTLPFVVAVLPFMAAFVENIGVRGTDNVMIPLLIVAAFTL
jgi:phytol kinase